MLSPKIFPVLAGMAALAAVALAAPPASADVISCLTGTLNCNLGHTEDFNSPVSVMGSGSGVTTPLTATALFENFAFSNGGTELTFQIDVTNTTPQPAAPNQGQWSSIRITDVAFNTNPNAATVTGSSTNSVFNTFTNENFPSFHTVDICNSSGSNCAGGASGGLSPVGTTNANAPNHETVISLDLKGLTPLNAGTGSIDIGVTAPGEQEQTFFKYQTGFGSFEIASTDTGVVLSIPPVPEPASLALLGTALAGFGVFVRGRRRRSA